MALYIHQLKDLTPKAAEIESTFIIREIRRQTPPPLTYESIFEYFSLFFVSESEKAAMAKSLDLVEPAVQAIIQLGVSRDPAFEPINLKRAVDMLKEIPEPLLLNLNYAKTISLWQEEFTQEFAPLINSLPELRTNEERVHANNRLNEIFLRLLRNDSLSFNFRDIIYEAHKNRVHDLHGSMGNGFLFKISLEEELKKLDFATRSRRIPTAKLNASDDIKAMIHEIKKGVDTAYDVNVRMMNWALVVYSYIKMMTAGQN